MKKEEKSMQKIVFATGNKDKMREIRMIMEGLPYEIISMKEAGINPEIIEDGTSFEENALIKSRAVAAFIQENKLFSEEDRKTVIVLADDSGLEIDALNKEPGIYSARYMGEDTSYRIKNKNLIDRLEGVADEDRTARFVCAVAAVLADGREEVTRATMEGRIGYEEKGENGFGYDPILFLPEFGCMSAELASEQKNAISHRGKALRMMRDRLQEM